MKKIALLVGLILASASCLFATTNAHAATRYTVTDQSNLWRPAYYHNRDTKSHYLWNQQHTRKLHNTKYFPHTTWVAQKTMLLTHGTHVARYYYVVSKNKRTAGWVWHGFLASGTYRYEKLTTDGLKLSTLLTSTDQNKLELFIMDKLQKDGYEANNHLAMMYDYYASNHLTPDQMSMAAVINLVGIKKLDADKITIVHLPVVKDIGTWIDPKNGNALLETNGQGQLGLKIVAAVERAMQKNHTSTYLLQNHFTNILTDSQLSFTLYVY